MDHGEEPKKVEGQKQGVESEEEEVDGGTLEGLPHLEQGEVDLHQSKEGERQVEEGLRRLYEEVDRSTSPSPLRDSSPGTCRCPAHRPLSVPSFSLLS